MKQRHYPWLTQTLYLTPITWVALAGCQGLAASSFVMLEPPALQEASAANERLELVPTLGPGNAVPTPSRLAQPTTMATSQEKATSAAPGQTVVRTTAGARSLLIKASACLESGDFPGAIVTLQRYLQAFPDAALIRLQLAELCFQQHNWKESQQHFMLALGEVVDPELPLHSRLHGHSRLMELAQERNDRFAEELHRGIGLTLLAERRALQPAMESSVSVQEILGKAQAALHKASRHSPHDARPHLYLISVWQGMQQTANAHSSWLVAQALALLSPVSEYEQLRLSHAAFMIKSH